MLSDIFYTVVKMNCISSVTAILLLAIKYVLHRLGCPRKILFMLWAVIAFRLICPTAPSSDLSLFNAARLLTNSETAIYYEIPQSAEVLKSPVPRQQTAPVYNPKQSAGFYLCLLWLSGVCVFGIFGAKSYLSLKKQLRFSIRLKENIYVSDRISSSFVFGIIRPKIYIPDNISEECLSHIILHEKTHIQRKDYLTKIAAYILLSVHWFNPFNRLLFRLFSDDMEFCCDESVIAKIGIEQKKAYLNSLLVSAVSRRKTVHLYGVFFSAASIKRRIANVISLKIRPKFLSVITIPICILLTASFASNASVADMQTQKTETVIPQAETPSSNNTPAEAPAAMPKAETTAAAEISSTQAPDVQSNVPITDIEEIPNQTEIFQSEEIAISDSSEHENTPPVMTYIDFHQIITDIQISDMLQKLHAQGLTQVSSPVVSGRNYTVYDYSYKNNCIGENRGITCSENGEISIYFSLNTDSIVNVDIRDSQGGEPVSFGILAGKDSLYSFSGLDRNKTYDVTVSGETGASWKIEGKYIIF
ncbi:MAG: M56 family metallopeptidase [Clostridia bacterium]|nr:M56 family metallopeptidase [Clostridia bacterium]